jgi:tetratricopeptide (TPR) repeat protein
MPRNRKALAAAILFALSIPVIAAAQGLGCPALAAIEGRVVFPYDRQPTFVDVSVFDEQSNLVQAITTTRLGDFLLRNMPAGRYFFEIHMAGFRPVHQMLAPDILDPISCTALRVTIQLRHLPGRKPEEEDVISLKAIKDNPADSYEDALKRGIASKDANRPAEAISTLTHALELNPASKKARIALGELYLERKEYQQAADLLTAAVRLGEVGSGTYYQLGLSYYKLGRLDLAEKSLERSIANSKDTLPDAYLVLYNVYMASKRPLQALETLQTYLDRFPSAKDREHVRSTADKLEKDLNRSAAAAANAIPQTRPDVAAAIQNATAYVRSYEAALGNLILSEDYLQRWTTAANPASRGASATIAGNRHRRTISDLLIVQVGDEWSAVRKVNSVDGAKVKKKQQEFETAFGDSPAGNSKQLESMRAESSKYNIGIVRRDINLPTFALKVLHVKEAARVVFEAAGTEKIEGVETRVIRFKETGDDTLVHDGRGQPLPSNGRLWIEPESGRVMKSEIHIVNPNPPAPIDSTTEVTYSYSSDLNLLVPKEMTEHYRALGDSIDTVAEYSNVRRFDVKVQFEIATPKP